MPKEFEKIDPRLVTENALKLIADDWFLITAGNLKAFNTMTASWGALGELWNRKVSFCFVRPTRHTYQFCEEHEIYTMSFFSEEHRQMLKYCGTKSGRDVDKAAETGITPVASESGSVYFNEARLVFECRKLYLHDLDPKHFLDPSIDDEYPKKDYHRMYVGEIVNCLVSR